jgi:hypothetical protein
MSANNLNAQLSMAHYCTKHCSFLLSGWQHCGGKDHDLFNSDISKIKYTVHIMHGIDAAF